jgi:hypothetical protein
MRTLLVVAGLALLAQAGAWAQTAAEKEIRARRDAFEKAMNDHKGKDVVAFLDPSFTWKTRDGKTMDYKTAAAALEQSVNSLPQGVTIKLKIEKLELKGDTATLTVSETVGDNEPQRSREVWKKIKGRWMLVSNEEL